MSDFIVEDMYQHQNFWIWCCYLQQQVYQAEPKGRENLLLLMYALFYALLRKIECTLYILLNKSRPREGTSRFRQENNGNRWNMETVFRPIPVQKHKKLAGIYRKIFGRNTASMFHRFPVFSCRIRWLESSTWEFTFWYLPLKKST